MKKIMLCLLLALSVILSSCDLFMEYEKPDLYLITLGLSYNENIPSRTTQFNTLPNARKDADTIQELFTGFADQAGMEWYSISCRDQYTSYEKNCYSTDGEMSFTLTSNTASTLPHPDYVNISELTGKETVLAKIKAMLLACPKHPTDKDIIIFYYAGHGLDETGHLWALPGQDPFDKKQANGENPKAVFTSDDLFGKEGLLEHAHGRKILILDSCHSGALINNRTPGGDNITGGGGNSDSSDHDNPYFDGWFGLRGYDDNDMLFGDDDILAPDRDPIIGEDEVEEEFTARAGSPKPDVYVITSASKEQEASDGDAKMPYGPFVGSIVESFQPGFQCDQEERPWYSGRMITLNDIYRTVKKAFRKDPSQDPQTLLTRYDIVLFDFTR